MKGIIFVELLAMADAAFGEDVVDEVIRDSRLQSGGAYTAVGTYPCEELFQLISGFSAKSGMDGKELQKRFGHWMMQSFSKHYPTFFHGKTHSLDMLESIETEIHTEVRKLYPDAELPSFDANRLAEKSLDLTYRSPRALGDFCEGLIEACGKHFDEELHITRRDRNSAVLAQSDFAIRVKIAG